MKCWIDENRKLMWEIKVDNQVKSWFEAKEYADKLNNNNYCKYNNWRIPTKEELETLIDNNLINLKDDHYWSSDEKDDNTAYRLSNASVYKKISYYDKNNAFYVRCVRSI